MEFMPGIGQRLTALVASSCLSVGFFGGAALADVQAGGDSPEVVRYTGPVDAADVMGGWVSTHVLVRVQPGSEPMVLDDGRWSFTRNKRLAGDAQIEDAIANVLAQRGAMEISPTVPFEFAYPELAQQFGLDRYFTVHVPAGTDTPALVAELNEFPTHIELAELDRIGGILQVIPNDPSFNLQYGLRNTGQTIQGVPGVPGADIKATQAWELHTGTDDIIVAVIDTGIATGHPDLAPKLVTGYNSMNNSNSVGDSWLIPHGTHVSGIAAAATNNGTGIAGVSWGARIMPIKVLNLFGGGNETDIANGVIWAADNGAHIGNMSLGVPGVSYFENACAYAHAAGMFLIAASGNTPGAAIGAPAKWPTVMCVGATNNQDNLASFTTTGAQMSVSAPGVDVYSTYMGLFGGSTYSYQSGTSMAAPHAAGVAALVWSANLDLTRDEVWSIMEQTADDKGTPGWNPQFGHGRLNAYEAVKAALDFSPPKNCGPDINCDGVVGVADLLLLLAAWGLCDSCNNCPEDLVGDCRVGVPDLLVLLENWG